MKSNEFIREHIKSDERQRSSKKLNLLSKKHKEFGYYLELIQKENIAKLFINLQTNGYLIQGMVKEHMTTSCFRHFINVLCANNFLEIIEPPEDIFVQVSEVYNDYIANKTNFFRLTKKGSDFLNLDIVKDYLIEEYEDYKNELL